MACAKDLDARWLDRTKKRWWSLANIRETETENVYPKFSVCGCLQAVVNVTVFLK